MRHNDFAEYLNEETKVSQLVTIIRKECAQWARNPVMLYRAKSITIKHWAKIKSHITDRRPLTSSPDLHNTLNKMFVKKFGWPVRNGVFCYSRSTFLGYGDVYIFIPAGNFKFVWSPEVSDLFTVLPVSDPKEYPQWAEMDYKKYLAKHIEKFEKNILDTYTDKGLQMAAKTSSEISINCKEYFLINQWYEPIIKANFNIE